LRSVQGAERADRLGSLVLQEQIEAERRALADTFTSVGDTAPTLCGAWTAFDLAAHVASLERHGGVATFVGRSLVARGVRLNDRVGGLTDRIIRHERRNGFDAVVDRLRQPSPRLLLRPHVAAVGLFELWMHHEDVAAPNRVDHGERSGLDQVLTWLIKYQSRTKAPPAFRIVSTGGRNWDFGPASETSPIVSGSLGDLVRWSAGRPVRSPLQMSGPDNDVARLTAFQPHV
jgi:uncharacterized protein (TIGR03083 family)